MVNGEIYHLVFMDSFRAAFTFSMESELSVFAVLVFGGYPAFISLLLAYVGSMLGLTINWMIGWAAVSFGTAMNVGGESATFQHFCKNARRYGKWLLLINWFVPFGSPITLIAGFVKIRPTVFFLLTGFSRAVFYAVIYYLYR